MSVVAALSRHPLAAEAVGEVVGEVLDTVGPAPDLVVLFASASHVGALEDVAAAIQSLLDPGAMIGCSAAMVAGGTAEVEGGPALALWAATGIGARAHRLTMADPALPLSGADGLLLLADPYTFDPAPLLASARGTPVVGGMASSALGPGGNRLTIGGRVHAGGAVAVTLTGAGVQAVVSQGARPIGDPMTVTRTTGSLIAELAGQPALDRVQAVIASLPPDDVQLAARRGLQLGRLVDLRRSTFRPGDFLVRDILGGDRATGAVSVADTVELGDTVQLHLRDAFSADDELHSLLAGRRASGALLFTSTGRGTALFGGADHDARVVSELLDGVALAGMSCAGELGPVGGRSFLHGLAASVLLVG